MAQCWIGIQQAILISEVITFPAIRLFHSPECDSMSELFMLRDPKNFMLNIVAECDKCSSFVFQVLLYKHDKY